MSPEMVMAVTGLVGVVATNLLAWKQLHKKIDDKADEQTALLAEKFDRASEINALQISASNNYHERFNKLQDQNNLMWRYLQLILKRTGIDLGE